MSAKTIVLSVFLVLFGTWAYAADCNGERYEDMGGWNGPRLQNWVDMAERCQLPGQSWSARR
jgi:hypothetical protein